MFFEVIMFKKFSYFATVSVLATTVMSQAIYAMDDDPSQALVVRSNSSSSSAGPLVTSIPDNTNFSTVKPRVYDGILNEVVNVIDDFLSQQTTPQPQPASSSSSTLWNVVQGTSSVLGNGFRKVGDLVRGNTAMGDLLANKGIEAVKYYAPVGGTAAAGLVNDVAANEGLLKSTRLGVGNGLRWIGGGIKWSAGNEWETPTLERELRDFWIAKGFKIQPDNVLKDTACALYLSAKVNGVDDLTLKYRNFVAKWNQNWDTTHSPDPAVNQENFVVGLIRALVQTEQAGDDKALSGLLIYNLDLATLPATKEVTEQYVKDQAKHAKKDLLADQVSTEVENTRKAKFLEFAKKVYALENGKYLANKNRVKALIVGNQPQPLAITAAPQQNSAALLPAQPQQSALPAPTNTGVVTITQVTTTATGTPEALARSMSLVTKNPSAKDQE